MIKILLLIQWNLASAFHGDSSQQPYLYIYVVVYIRIEIKEFHITQ